MKYILPVASLLLLAGCSQKSNMMKIAVPQAGQAGQTVQAVPVAVTPLASKPVNMLLKASVFKMSGDYADHVAITVDANGRVTYYPAPSDISAISAPVAVGDGWYLNRQGLGPNSVFTKYTFDEYRALKTAPSAEEMKAAVIPGAKVTAFERLSIPASDAMNLKPEEILSLIKK